MVSSVVRDQSGRGAAATGAAARGAASPDGGAAIEVGCDSLLAPGSRLLLMSRELKQEQCQGRRHRLSSSHFPRKTGVHLDELRVGSVKAPIERTNTMTDGARSFWRHLLSYVWLALERRCAPRAGPLNSNWPSTSTRSLSRSTRSPPRAIPRARPRPWPPGFAPRA